MRYQVQLGNEAGWGNEGRVGRDGKNNSGFTLTELLVAMAIFVTLMGSLVALFTGSVNTTRAGYSRLASFEIGRTITEVLKRDLSSAFTARDNGDDQQFYGQGNGFSFVGANENGELSRISYAVVRVNDEKDFVGEFGEELGILVRRAMTQGTKYGVASDPLAPPSVSTGITLAQNLISALAETGAFDDVTIATTAWNQMETFRVTPPLDWAKPFLTDDSYVVNADAVYQMASLVRFEEIGKSELDAFVLPGDLGKVKAPPRQWTSQWPKFNPSDFGLDVYELQSSLDPPNSNYDIYARELSSISFGGTAGIDMRSYLSQASYISTKTVENMLRADRRKLWVEMLTNSFSLSTGTEYIWNFWGTPDMWARNATFAADLYDPLDYTVADEFVLRAIIRDSDQFGITFPSLGGGRPNFVLQDNRYYPRSGVGVGVGDPVDLFGSPTFFNYAQGSVNSGGNFLETFNSNENIAGYDFYLVKNQNSPCDVPGYTAADCALANNTNPDLLAGWQEFDQLLLDTYSGFKSETGLQGSPLLPHIPSLIKVQFWVARHGVSVGDPPVKHWFAEVVDVPAGMTRKQQTTIVAEQ